MSQDARRCRGRRYTAVRGEPKRAMSPCCQRRIVMTTLYPKSAQTVFRLAARSCPNSYASGPSVERVRRRTSKAWCVQRVGSAVFLKWGAVEVRGAGSRAKGLLDASCRRRKQFVAAPAQRAQDYAKAAIARRRNHRYEPLTGPIANRRRFAGSSAELKQALATILIVDIVRSTEKAAKLGDARWTAGDGYYYAAVRKELKSSRGRKS